MQKEKPFAKYNSNSYRLLNPCPTHYTKHLIINVISCKLSVSSISTIYYISMSTYNVFL